MNLPTIIVNFKTYESATGQKALELAKIHEKVAKELEVSMGVCVQLADLKMIADAVSIPVFAQHIDPVGYGSNTGHVMPEAVKEAGAYGTLLNHAERQIPMDVLEKSINSAKEAGLYTVVCANTPETGVEIAKLGPDLIAVEPPDLIGGDVSVSSAEPEIITKACDLIGGEKLLVGAGVKTGEDVKTCIELGSTGVLLASGVTKAEDPEAVLRDLANGLK
ncbi:triose-phosphate isomerase [Patescibacteria group bacterium]